MMLRVAQPIRVLDEGPIPYSEIDLHGDVDLEHGLRHAGFDPDATAYRLIEIAVESIDTTATMERWTYRPDDLVEAVRDGLQLPPIVVVAGVVAYVLIDGVHRTFAHWHLGRAAIQAYEVLT
jgi:hypothetical protein